jgi:hypothetical protein
MRFIALSFLAWLLLPAAATAQSDAPQGFKAMDLDALFRAVGPYPRQGLDILTNWDGYVLEGKLVRAPVEDSDFAKALTRSLGYIGRTIPAPTAYRLDLQSKKGRVFQFHLQDITAASILGLIQRDGQSCCVGRTARVWARYIYRAPDGPGLAIVYARTGVDVVLPTGLIYDH